MWLNKRLCAKINNGHVISKEEINANGPTELSEDIGVELEGGEGGRSSPG